MDIGGGRTLAGHVMIQGQKMADWLATDIVDVALLVPRGDPLAAKYGQRWQVFEGSEDDVLERYFKAMEHYKADYVVRLTGDCAWMTTDVIMKCIRNTTKYGADYCSNVLVRTFMEGLDVEVLSRRLLTVLHKRVVSPDHREHVTSAIPSMLEQGELPGFVIHTVLAKYDLSHIKTSIDTPEEYEGCNARYSMLRNKKLLAMEWGSTSN